ncbi:unnamed protein product [Nesidiocoris tenuis]|uniref:Uncharacterized protein n=1 Tax=Nesidiocoris tenuis TaxID=355587 RepID=A0A6H5GN00_9HEMI|nr:unnamed protein product [Nesidiocoris tenuis]
MDLCSFQRYFLPGMYDSSSDDDSPSAVVIKAAMITPSKRDGAAENCDLPDLPIEPAAPAMEQERGRAAAGKRDVNRWNTMDPPTGEK